MRTFSVCMVLGVLVLVQRINLGTASFSKSTIYLRKFTFPDGALKNTDHPIRFAHVTLIHVVPLSVRFLSIN